MNTYETFYGGRKLVLAAQNEQEAKVKAGMRFPALPERVTVILVGRSADPIACTPTMTTDGSYQRLVLSKQVTKQA